MFFFPFVNFFYTSLVESPTNFQQRYANYAHYTVQPRSHTTHSAARPPLEEGRSHHLEISSAIVSGGEERVKNKIDFNDNKKYIYIEKKKNPETQVGRELTLVGGRTPQARPCPRVPVGGRAAAALRITESRGHTARRHYSLLHKRTLTESGSPLKACGGEGGLFKAKSVPARGGPGPSPASSPPGGLPWPPGTGWRWQGRGGRAPRQAGRHQTSRSQEQKTSQQWQRQPCPVSTVWPPARRTQGRVRASARRTSREGVAGGGPSLRLAVRQTGSAILSCPSGLPRA